MLAKIEKEQGPVQDDGYPPPRGISTNLNNNNSLFENEFRKKWFPQITDENWLDWKWQVANRITEKEEIEKYIDFTPSEKAAFELGENNLPFSITPYYLSLIDLNDKKDSLRKTVIPRIEETIISRGESDDPLGENGDSPVPSIVHRYPDRVLFLTTSFCSVYCRYCTRSRMVGGHCVPFNQYWQAGIDYIKDHPEIRDVVISGGDPLLLEDDKIEWLLDQVYAIDHVEMVRIGTKTPMVLPMRFTPNLLRILSKHRPLFLSIHCTHPNEITSLSRLALNSIADSGIVMGSQTVLLKEINDDHEILKSLFHKLLECRVKPYYLFQCDPITGSSHFRTTVEKGKQIMFNLRGFTSGYAIPYYVIDAPGGGGKVPILPEYEIGNNNGERVLRNYEGKNYSYIEEKAI